MSNTSQSKQDTLEKRDNLVHLDGENTRGNPNELNAKIQKIDTNLDSLKTELNEVNTDVQDSLVKLSDEGSDLTNRVSATYKQLGNLEKSYLSLTDRSSQIKEEINTVSKSLVELAEKSDEDVAKLTNGQQDLIEKTQELVEKSRKTARTLNKSIKENSAAMKTLELQLSSEIETLATSTKDRDDALEENIKGQQARLLQLQEVDKALGQRATSLEQASAALHKKSKALSRSHNLLNRRAEDLAADIVVLQKQASEHGGLIHNLQEHAATLTDVLVDLARLEKRHFIGLASVLGLLIVAFIAYTFNQQTNWKAEGATNTTVQTELQTINNKLVTMNTQVQNMDDSVKTLDGRLNTVTPLSQFGGDNTIHGPEWLAQQSAEQFVILLAVVSDKQDLYKTASQYSFYLKEKLAFLPMDSDKYGLLYGGYQNQHDAQTALRNLPHYIQFNRPMVYRLGDVQAQSLSRE